MTSEAPSRPPTSPPGHVRATTSMGIALWAPLVGLTAFLAVNGRLIADDYCNASRAGLKGVAGATGWLFNSWHGGWSADLVASSYGWALLQLPARFGYLPFVLTTMALIIVAARSASIALALAESGERALWKLYVPILTTVMILGFVSLSRNQDLLYSAFLWQAASIVHLWPTLLALVLLTAVFESRHRGGWRVNVVLFVATVFVAGFNFTETAILGVGAGVLGLAGAVAARSAVEGAVAARLAQRFAVMALVALLSFAAMYGAPGTAIRRTALPSDQSGPVARISHFQDLVGNLAGSALGRHGMLLAILTGLGLVLASVTPAARAVQARRAAAVAIALGTIGSLGVLLAAGGEFASYQAPWHSFALIPLWMLAAVAVGMCLGDVVARGLDGSFVGGLAPRISSLARLLPLTVGVILVLQIVWYAGPLTGRVAAWDRGEAAPFAGAADREEPWVRDCWSEIQESGYVASPLRVPRTVEVDARPGLLQGSLGTSATESRYRALTTTRSAEGMWRDHRRTP